MRKDFPVNQDSYLDDGKGDCGDVLIKHWLVNYLGKSNHIITCPHCPDWYLEIAHYKLIVRKMEPDKLQDWIIEIIRGMVSKPEEVTVVKVIDDEGVHYILKVAKDDIGKIIGKGGEISNALRTIVRCAGHLYDVRATLKIDH